MNVTWDELDSYGLSGRLWKKFALPSGGNFDHTQSGNPAIGFFDHFLSFHANSLDGPYLILEGSNATVEQINCTGLSATGGLGLVQLATTGAGSGGANEEAVLQWGRGICAPFKLTGKDLCFEARIAISEITADKWSWAVGLGEVGMGTTDCLFVDTTGALADKNFLGFVHLKGEAGAVDGAYKADGKDYQDGATKTKLNALHTMVAGSFVKLGFRYQAHPKMIQWYVNGVEITAARLLSSEVDADTFPDDVFVTPILGLKDIAGDDSVNLTADWWACAQAI